jgi:hypothetical protein
MLEEIGVKQRFSGEKATFACPTASAHLANRDLYHPSLLA